MMQRRRKIIAHRRIIRMIIIRRRLIIATPLPMRLIGRTREKTIAKKKKNKLKEEDEGTNNTQLNTMGIIIRILKTKRLNITRMLLLIILRH